MRNCSERAVASLLLANQPARLGKTSVVRITVHTVGILQGCSGRKLEASLHLSLNIERSALEAAVRVLLEDRLVVALRVFTAFHHGGHDGEELFVEVSAVVCVGRSLSESTLAA